MYIHVLYYKLMENLLGGGGGGAQRLYLLKNKLYRYMVIRMVALALCMVNGVSTIYGST